MKKLVFLVALVAALGATAGCDMCSFMCKKDANADVKPSACASCNDHGTVSCDSNDKDSVDTNEKKPAEGDVAVAE